jgi:hypothetical protein
MHSSQLQVYKQKHSARFAVDDDVELVHAGHEDFAFTSCFHGWSTTSSIYNTLEHPVPRLTMEEYQRFLKEINDIIISGLPVERI